jgi:hypothetical protein
MKGPRIYRLSFVLVPLLLAYSTTLFASDADQISEEDDIREAVFLYQFDHNASGLQKHAHAYCIFVTINDRRVDPSNGFLKRFAHHKPPVRKGSACHWTSGVAVYDRGGRPALIFTISKINWVSGTEVTVEGGYEEGNVSSSAESYAVNRQSGKWVVTEGPTMVISQNQIGRRVHHGKPPEAITTMV